MADLLKMDPARIARLRDPARLEELDPLRILEAATPQEEGTLVDVGSGVGFVTLPLAERLPQRDVVACDVLEGMLEALAQDAAGRGLGNVTTAPMTSHTALPLPDASAAMLVMLQVHHELDDAVSLLTDCRRVLRPRAPLVIVDWRDEDLPGMPAGGRRVARARIEQDLAQAGFAHVENHDLYRLHVTLVGRTD